MPETLEEAYGTQSQGSEDVGFFESALAGVATGLWNIPKGVLSLGAEVFDLVGDTNTARDIEEWFDDETYYSSPRRIEIGFKLEFN